MIEYLVMAFMKKHPTGDPGLVLWSTMLALSGCGGLVTMKKLGKKKDEE